MELYSLINFCKEKYPEKIIEICEIVDLLIDTLNSLKSDVGKAIPNLNEDDSFESAHQYLNYSEKISNIIQRLNKISNNIIIDETKENNPEQYEINMRDINYNDKSFNVDPKVSHSLYKDFTYTKPAGIQIENVYLEANTWQDILNKCCQYLYKKEKNIFRDFPNNDMMKGRSCKYFSYDPTDLRDPSLIADSSLYVENNVSATFVRNLIIKMLEQYEIPKRHCHIFIRRDLTSAHSANIDAEEVAKSIENSNDEIKIGQYAKKYFKSYFQSHNSEEEINNFTNKDWCHDTFGICYPILKKIDIELPINEQVNYNNQYRRYYTNPVLKIRDGYYIICSQWYASYKSKLTAWIKNNSKDNKQYTNQVNKTIKLGKEYSGVSLPTNLFVFILKTIEQYQNTQFETGILTSNLSDIISKQTNYEKPQHVVNNIRKYLEDKKIISLCNNCKKGKYQIIDINALKILIEQYSVDNRTILPQNTISYDSRVFLYSYYDKKQIIVNVGNLEDEYVYLHDDCVGKKAGDKFNFNSKEYVVVSFKNKRNAKRKLKN